VGVVVVEGSEANLKVTTPADLAYFQYLRTLQCPA